MSECATSVYIQVWNVRLNIVNLQFPRTVGAESESDE